MNKLVKEEIKKLYKSFNKTDNAYEKEYILSFFDYLKNVFIEDKEIIKMSDDINYKMMSLREDRIWFLLTRENKINKYVFDNKDFFYENIPVPNEFHKISQKSIFPLDEDNVIFILEEFFKSINEDLYEFYQMLNDEERVIYGLSNETAYTSLNNSNTVIFIKGLEDLIDMMVLVHEIGHSYYFYINNTKIAEREEIDVEIKEEIPAKILEIKFIKFLRDNGFYEQSMVLKNLFDYVFYEYGKSNNKYEGLKYIIASHVANTQGEDADVESFFKYIYGTSTDKIILDNNKKNSDKKLYK